MFAIRWLAMSACWICVVTAAHGPQATTQQGTLRGTYLRSGNGKEFAAFQGIPYAKPPIGELRFKAPVAADPWRGVWNAVNVGSSCMQRNVNLEISGEEDCLFLNVYTPKDVGPSAKLDVIVNIHGGAFMEGNAELNGPKYLLNRRVILVTMNHRLGPLGYFSTGDEVVPGNNGQKDQVLALRWVQKNIAAFGGNPDRVTLSGTSSGAACSHLHFFSPLSKGLFHRGISVSGTALNPWALVEGLKQRGQTLADQLGCPTSNSQEMIDCLRTRPARVIVERITHFRVWRIMPLILWGPTIEVPGPDAFLTEHPIDMLVEGRAHNVPWMTGVTSGEGLVPYAADFLMSSERTNVFRDHFQEWAPMLLEYNETVALDQRLAVAQRIKKFYLGDKEFSQDTAEEIIKMHGDRWFVAPAQQAAQLQAHHNSAPVYFHQFAYRGKHSLSEYLSKTNALGVCHGDDTAFIFDTYYSITDETEADVAMSNFLVDIWMNFVNSRELSPANVSWRPVQPGASELNFLHIASHTDVGMRTSADLGNQRFWDTLAIREATINFVPKKSRVVEEL